jgi:hypothetical protein
VDSKPEAVRLADNYDNILIFGAQVIAQSIYAALKEYYRIPVRAFVVSGRAGNPGRIDDVPVLLLREAGFERGRTLVLLAVSEPLHREAAAALALNGYGHVLGIDSRAEYLIMAPYFRNMTQFALLEDCAFAVGAAARGDWRVYMARSAYDRPLAAAPELPEWVVPLHAGAALDGRRLAETADDSGDNISARNRSYAELTATYWVWKNTRCRVKGVCHYRRMLAAGPEALEALESGRIDAVLPLPFVCLPDTRAQWGRFVPPGDWAAAEKALEEAGRPSGAEAGEILAGRYHYSYNMLIARAEVFDDYCAWLFGALERAEAHGAGAGGGKVMAYMGEVLTSLYFMSRRRGLRVVHGEKEWIM